MTKPIGRRLDAGEDINRRKASITSLNRMSISGQRIVLQRKCFGLFLELFELSCQVFVRRERFLKTHESANQ